MSDIAMQLQGTPICGDFHCSCGHYFHTCGERLCWGVVRCGKCGARYNVPDVLVLTPCDGPTDHEHVMRVEEVE